MSPRPTQFAHWLLALAIEEGDLVIDATAGNGYDTQFLAEKVGIHGRVLAFDIQKTAIDSSRARITAAGLTARVEFFQESHSHIEDRAAPETVSAIVFNLGYLPGSEHGITTFTKETLLALQASVRVIKRGGMLSVLCYPGHEEGALEAIAVENWMAALAPEGWQICKYGMIGTLRAAPYLLCASRR